MHETIFSNLDRLARNPGSISDVARQEQWKRVPFAAGEIEGNMLMAGEPAHPEPLQFDLGLKGYYKIFLGLIRMPGRNYLQVKLSGDDAYWSMSPDNRRIPFNHWMDYEYVQESFWRYAKLDGQDLYLKKPGSAIPCISTLAWVRCVPMTDEEIAEYEKEASGDRPRVTHLHFDPDSYVYEGVDTLEDFLTPFSSLKFSDAECCTIEVFPELDAPDDDGSFDHNIFDSRYSHAFYRCRPMIFDAQKKRVELLHKYGIRVFAGYRACMGSFHLPLGSKYNQIAFSEDHPEYFIKNRDGSKVSCCSYAYREVQDELIEKLKRIIDCGFDGVSLLYQRGVYIGFDEPVLERFAARYPGLDPHRLPIADERLNGIWCEIMTEFMQRLTHELEAYAKRHIAVNVIVGYSPVELKWLGLDTGAWARAGLIDCICQDIMESFENLDGCLADDGLIDLDKYRAVKKQRRVLDRYHDFDPEKQLAGLALFRKELAGTNVVLYASISSTCDLSVEEITDYVKQLRKHGYFKYSLFNYCYAAPILPRFQVLSRLGHSEIPAYTHTTIYHRMQMLDGNDMSVFNADWRG